MWSEKVTVIRKTDKAILIEYETVQAWIPISLILDESEIFGSSAVGEEGELCISERIAEEKGLMI